MGIASQLLEGECNRAGGTAQVGQAMAGSSFKFFVKKLFLIKNDYKIFC